MEQNHLVLCGERTVVKFRFPCKGVCLGRFPGQRQFIFSASFPFLLCPFSHFLLALP